MAKAKWCKKNLDVSLETFVDFCSHMREGLRKSRHYSTCRREVLGTKLKVNDNKALFFPAVVFYGARPFKLCSANHLNVNESVRSESESLCIVYSEQVNSESA